VASDPADQRKRPLADKLGIKEGTRAAVINAPPGYCERLRERPSAFITETFPVYLLDFIQLFAANRKELESEFPRLKRKMTQGGALWISWPKRSSGVKTDLTGAVVREIGLGEGLVDVKVAAVDETWSGLKFVRRLRDRR